MRDGNSTGDHFDDPATAGNATAQVAPSQALKADQSRRDLLFASIGVLGLTGCLADAEPIVSEASFPLTTLGSPEVGSVATIAALRTKTPGAGNPETFIVLGHSDSADGGGGTFYWDPAATGSDDNALRILPTGHAGNGRWLRAAQGAYNVKWFGAVSGDCTTKIQAAINTGRDVYFPPGTYNISAALTVATQGQRLTGAGKNLTILKQTVTEKNGIEISASDVIIEHIAVRDVSSTDERWGIVVLANVAHVVVQHCRVTNCDDAGIRFGYLHGSVNDRSTNCRALFCDVDNITGGAGIEFINCNQPLALGCRVDTVSTFGIRMVDCYDARAVGNYVTNWGTSGNQGAGICAAGGSLRGASRRNLVSDNTFVSGAAARPAIYIAHQSQYHTIESNVIEMHPDAAAPGILLDNSSAATTLDFADITLTNNFILKGTRSIDIQGQLSSGNITISGGRLKGFTEYGVLISNMGSLGDVTIDGGILIEPATAGLLGIHTNKASGVYVGNVRFQMGSGTNINNALPTVPMERGETRTFCLLNNSATSVPMAHQFGIFAVHISENPQFATGYFDVKNSGVANMTAGFQKSAEFDVSKGAMSGSTGVSGHVAISAHSDGKLYLENRIGGSRVFTLTVH
jgi:hypothetical protein